MTRIRDAQRDNLNLGLDVLRCLVGHRTSRGVTQIASELKLPVSTTHDLLQLLRQLGFVLQDAATKRYRVSPKIFDFIEPFASRYALAPATHDFLRTKAEKQSVTVFISAFWGNKTYVICAYGPHGGTVALGSHGPGYTASCAKVLISKMPVSKWPDFAPNKDSQKVTPYTNIDPDVFYHELRRAQSEGVAFNERESSLGLCSVAAPLPIGLSNDYALALVYPYEQWTRYSREELIGQIKQWTQELLNQGFPHMKSGGKSGR